MSIAITLKVHDGVVLAADSASTLMLNTPQGPAGVVTVYNNANKIFNLYKGLPIGCVTFGAGSIGNSSVATLLKDFRRELAKPGAIDPNRYTVEDVARRLAAFLHQATKSSPQPGQLGLTISGYSAGANLADEWAVELNGPDNCRVDQTREPAECGIRWGGQGEAIERLVMGFSPIVAKVIYEVAVNKEAAGKLIEILGSRSAAPLIQAPMPIQDAIDLARFLVDTSIMFARFMPGAPTVGGPVEIAAITKHEGFKWVVRKHYWDAEYNREGKA